MRRQLTRILGLAAGTLAVLWFLSGCSRNSTAPGTGLLDVSLAFDDGLPAKPAIQEEFAPGDTPLADLILNIDSVAAYACPDTDTVIDEEVCAPYPVPIDSTLAWNVAGLDTTLAHYLGETRVPAGDYQFLTLGISKALVVTQAGDTVQATVPSSRIQVHSPFTLDDGETIDITIVFDVTRSVVETPPGSMRFLVQPVLHATQGWSNH